MAQTPPINIHNLDCLINEIKAAEYLGYSPRTLQKWRVYGGGPVFVKPSGRSIRYRWHDLNEWIEARCISSTSEFEAPGK